jgi:hypothetical protein
MTSSNATASRYPSKPATTGSTSSTPEGRGSRPPDTSGSTRPIDWSRPSASTSDRRAGLMRSTPPRSCAAAAQQPPGTASSRWAWGCGALHPVTTRRAARCRR